MATPLPAKLVQTPGGCLERKKLHYSQAVAAVHDEIQHVLLHTPSVISEITHALSLSTGKGIRGKLTILSACDEQNKSDIQAVKVAAAIELLHLATLIHDDVIDDAEMRRGQPSLYRQFGKKNAIVSGDYLFCLCFNLISQAYSHTSGKQYINRISDFSRVMSAVCLGEIRQHSHNFNFHLRTKDYLRIISGKTTALFALSMYAGARSGDASHESAVIYGNIGKCFGSIFQLIDDCIDYEMNLTTANKPVVQDLRAGVITLPLIYAMRRDEGLYRLVCQLSEDTAHLNEFSFYQDIARRVKRLGGIQYTKMIAKRYYDKALVLIDKIENELKRERLKNLLDQAYYRES